MTEAVAEQLSAEPPKVGLRKDWRWRLLNELFALFVALLFILAALLVLLDSAPGHRFIADQVSKLETASGLRIRIGRIDGSIFGKTQLRNVMVADQRGVFLTSPNIKLDWTPGAWLYNKLYIDSMTAERVTLIRLPRRSPARRKGRSFPASTSTSASFVSTGSTSGPKSAASRAAGASGARQTSIGTRARRARGFHQQWRRPHRTASRCRARSQQVRSPCAVIAPADGLIRPLPASGGSRSLDRRAMAAGRIGAAGRRSTSPGARRHDWPSARTTASIVSRASGRRRYSSRASCSG